MMNENQTPLPTYEEVTGEDPYNPGIPIIKRRSKLASTGASASVILPPSRQTEVVIGGMPMSSLPWLPGQMGIPKIERELPMPWQKQIDRVVERFDPNVGGFEPEIVEAPKYQGAIIKRVRPDGQIELFRTPKTKRVAETPSGTLVYHPNMNSSNRLWDNQSADQQIRKAQSAGYLYKGDEDRVVKQNPNAPIRILPSGEKENISWSYPSPFAHTGEIQTEQRPKISTLGQVAPRMKQSSQVAMPYSSLPIHQTGQKIISKASDLMNAGNALQTALEAMRLEKRIHENPTQAAIRMLGGKTQLQMDYEKSLEKGNDLFTTDEDGNRVRKDFTQVFAQQSADPSNWRIQPANKNEKTNPLATVFPLNKRVAAHMQKDMNMAEKATQFIGTSAAPADTLSSTRNYQAAWRDLNRANTGKYSPDDVIMLSGSLPAQGVSNKQIKQTFANKIAPLLDKAIAQQSSFVVGNAKGNDKLAQEYLKLKGYQSAESPAGFSIFRAEGKPLENPPTIWETPHKIEDLLETEGERNPGLVGRIPMGNDGNPKPLVPVTYKKITANPDPLNPIVGYDTIVNKARRNEQVAGIEQRYVPFEWDRWSFATDPIIQTPRSAGTIYQTVPTKDGQGLRVIKNKVEGLEHGKDAIGGWQDPITGEFRTPIDPRTGEPYKVGQSVVYKIPMIESDRQSQIGSIKTPEGAKIDNELKTIHLKDTNVDSSTLEKQLSIKGGFPKILSIVDETGEDTGRSIIVTGASHLSKMKPDGTPRILERLTPEGADHLYSMAQDYALSRKLPQISNPSIINILPKDGAPTVPIAGLQTLRQYMGRTKNEAGLYELMSDPGGMKGGIRDLSEAQVDALYQNHDPATAAQNALDAELALGNPKITATGKFFAPPVDSIYESNYRPERISLSRHINADGSRDRVILPPVGERTYALSELVSHYPELDTNKGGRTTLVSELNAQIDGEREVEKSNYNPMEQLQKSDESAGQEIAQNLLDAELANRSSVAQVEYQPVVSAGEFRSIAQGIPGINLPESIAQRERVRLSPNAVSEQIAKNHEIAKSANESYQQEIERVRSQLRDVAEKSPKFFWGNGKTLREQAKTQQWDEKLNTPMQELESLVYGMRDTDEKIMNQTNPEYLGQQDIQEMQTLGKAENKINQAQNLGWKPDPLAKLAGTQIMAEDAKNFLNQRVNPEQSNNIVSKMLKGKIQQIVGQTMPTADLGTKKAWQQHWGDNEFANGQDKVQALNLFRNKIQDWGIVDPGGSTIDAPIDAQAGREIDRALHLKGQSNQKSQWQQEWQSLRGQHSNLSNAIPILREKLKLSARR